MKKNLLKLFFSSIILLLISCSSDEIERTTFNDDVYVSGSKANHASYWINNTFVSLTDAGFATSSADTLIVRNNDVHILGSGNNGVGKTLYWKNNVLTNLTDAFSTPTEIATISTMDIDSNNDVYFAGITQNTNVSPNTYDLVYWKNGIKHIVDSFTSEPYHLIGLKVMNTTVYITNARESGGSVISGYYINGTYFWGINANAAEVYVYGRTNVDGFYKNITNNTQTNLTTNLSVMIPTYEMCFDTGAVYAVNDLYVYKNGTVFYTLPSPTAAYTYSRIENAKFKNNSAYIMTEDGDLNNTTFQKVFKDNVLLIQNNVDEQFKCIYID
ncbi:MAG: hypothetical protein K2P85_02535 [Flavobacteriaceae bacterium]|nr:hypothetical protein [Flavobacteriaceae bacterium]